MLDQIRDEAHKRDLTVDAYLAQLIRAAPTAAPPAERTGLHEVKIEQSRVTPRRRLSRQEIDSILEEGSDAPTLDEHGVCTYSRADIYFDHD
ncbi:MAG TPA: hypothetical protein VK986_20505 [Tepidisphaeraceae bacterium]|nr:hypothetical protein [Tepidisphaeraceae bacterium]